MLDLMDVNVTRVPTIAPRELRFAIEPVGPFLKEGAYLFVLHREEVTADKDINILNIDEDYYERNERSGRLVVVTARSFGLLVGYFLWSVSHNPRYKDVLVAQEDVHFLHKDYRKGWNGYLLMRRALDVLKPLGVRYAFMREKLGHEHPAIMKRLGGKPLDITYSFRIE